MKIVAALACRNNSKRLYGKPLQRLGNLTVLEYMIRNLQLRCEIDSVVLAISEAKGNEAFQELAIKYNLNYVLGDDTDVVKRLILACRLGGGDTIFRVTTESPFTYFEALSEAVRTHRENRADYTAISDLPDGSSFELISLRAMEEAHALGEPRHRSEFCTLYMNENKEKYVFNVLPPKPEHKRSQYRLTIDFPEDLILCRKIVQALGEDGAMPFDKLIPFLDQRPDLVNLVANLTDENYIKFYF